ncbi:MAG: cobalamin-dependent protein, partial [bacterium]
DEKPIIIGERINPTGKKKFKEALRQKDYNYILQEALKQEDSGAHILDVNVGLPEIDEPDMIDTVIRKLQSITALPLQIDTSDFEAMEIAMRHYNGKPMINSVNGKQETMEAVFPLVAKYGGVVVGLTLDENGIPNTPEGRIAIARKIYETAASYGISQDDIIIDGLAMTISSDPLSARTTLETIRWIRDELHGHSILGVSNISFGLPQRPLINANFFTMAMQNGLSCAIINPNSEAMMASYRSFNALMNYDENDAEYIAAYGGTPKARPITQTAQVSLSDAIIRGLSEEAIKATRLELEKRSGLDIIEEILIPALDIVGQGFEKGTMFLPQLLMSAQASKEAFNVIKEAMAGTPQDIKGRIVLATVKGDIHDIGKNIVRTMLENYGYEVIDLGKDVAPEIIVDTAIKENIALVGLSALMTTTVVSMEDTIKLLRERKPDTKVVVGGAVMTQEYADQIGADHYARDAMDTVRYADEIFKK